MGDENKSKDGAKHELGAGGRRGRRVEEKRLGVDVQGDGWNDVLVLSGGVSDGFARPLRRAT